jgi:AcrR family transcriptional regulator
LDPSSTTNSRAKENRSAKRPRTIDAANRVDKADEMLRAAMAMMTEGIMPSVPAVAKVCGISRATAYRCFASRSKLISAVVAESLGPMRSFEPSSDDGRTRLRELFKRTFPRLTEFEPHLRAALQVALEHQALDRVGRLNEPAFRRGARRDILLRTAAPLRKELGPAQFDRFVKAVSLIYGIETLIVMKDIWQADDAEVIAVAQWMLEALIGHALAEPPQS